MRFLFSILDFSGKKDFIRPTDTLMWNLFISLLFLIGTPSENIVGKKSFIWLVAGYVSPFQQLISFWFHDLVCCWIGWLADIFIYISFMDLHFHYRSYTFIFIFYIYVTIGWLGSYFCRIFKFKSCFDNIQVNLKENSIGTKCY